MAVAHLQAITEEVSRAPDSSLVITGALIAVLLTGTVWAVVGHAITIAHEGGHALMALLFGGRVGRVRLELSQDGETIGESLNGFLAKLSFQFAGYVGPSLFGLLGAFVLATGRVEAVLWLSVALLALLLTAVRNLFGVLSVLATGAVLVFAATRATPTMQVLVASTWVWLLLVGGLLHILQHGRSGADHATLRSMTWIPRLAWAFIFAFVALASIILAGMLLLGG